MLSISNLTFRYGGRAIFDRAGVAVAAGHRCGLIGRNGSGKSTLLKLILGELHPDEGAIDLPTRARVGHLSQQAPEGVTALIDFVLAADIERAALLGEAETATDPGRIAEIHDRLATIRAHSAPARAAAILAGLGFDHEAQQRPLDDYSGGWRMRVALAATLFANPDLMLLDEPSNHLDLEARLWLEAFLAQYPGTLILVSHDRDLLNAVVEEIVHIDGGKLVMYRGDYDNYERTRAERQALRAAEAAKQLAQRRHIQSFIDRFRYKASKARQAQSRIKMLERMGSLAPVARDEEIAFDFPSPEKLAPPILTLERVEAGYVPGKPVLRRLDLRIDMDDRIALLGQNGNGKSTLLKLLTRRLEPMGGSMRRAQKLRVGYFDQEQAQAFSADRTAYHHLAELMPDRPEVKLRAHLGRFGFAQDRADRRVGELSGGERARLLFALITRDAPHLLLLDEPTNHLDIEARDALVTALNAYDGAVVLVSHDPRLVAATADRLWLVADGTCRPFDGDLDDYRRHVTGERRAAERNGAQRPDAPAKPRAANRRDDRRAAAEARERMKPLRRAVQAAEVKMQSLHREKEELERRLADPASYSGAPAGLAQINRSLAATRAALDAAEAEWLAAHEALDSAEESARSPIP
ncbi:MAG: ATP-binding cassette domain-containing protein [Alphaproteobacteria bacterium]|nr:ATP-binding cassette domain-containing protein [Alphaproteobacteria bacterium]